MLLTTIWLHSAFSSYSQRKAYWGNITHQIMRNMTPVRMLRM